MKRFTLAVLPLTIVAAACTGSDHPNPTGPSVSASAPGVLQAGRYEMLITGGTLAGSCSGSIATTPDSPVPNGAAHVGMVNVRAENGDWIATSTMPGDTLRVRFMFDGDGRAFTGSVQGRAAALAAFIQAMPSLDVQGARLSGNVLDPEQGLGAIDVFGTIAGQLVFTNAQGAVTCSGGSLILQRGSGL